MKRGLVIFFVTVALIIYSSACGKKAPPSISGHNHYLVSTEQKHRTDVYVIHFLPGDV